MSKLKYKVGDVVTIKSFEEITKMHPEYLKDKDLMGHIDWQNDCGRNGVIVEIWNEYKKWPYSISIKSTSPSDWDEDELYNLIEKLELLG